MVSILLYDLPQKGSYKIILMKRNIDEVLESQKKMLIRQRAADLAFESDKMTGMYEKHLKHVYQWLEGHQNMDVIYVKYNEIIERLLSV